MHRACHFIQFDCAVTLSLNYHIVHTADQIDHLPEGITKLFKVVLPFLQM